MKKSLLVAMLLILTCQPGKAQFLITNFGSATTLNGMTNVNTLTPSSDLLGSWTGMQTSTTFSVSNVSNQSGGIFSTLETAVDVQGTPVSLQLTGMLDGNPPGTGKFQIELFDSNFDGLIYGFNWSTFAGGSMTLAAPLISTTGSQPFSGIVSSYQLQLFGAPGDTVSFTFETLAATSVPEPMPLALVGCALGWLCVLTRKRQSVAEN